MSMRLLPTAARKAGQPVRGAAIAPAQRIALITADAHDTHAAYGAWMGEMLDARHRVLLVAPNFDQPLVDAVHGRGGECEGYELVRGSLSPFDPMKSLRQLVVSLKEWRPHVVIGVGLRAAVLGALAARRAGGCRIVTVVSGLGPIFHEMPEGVAVPVFGRAGRRAHRMAVMGLARALKVSDVVAVHNRYDAQLLRTLVPAVGAIDVVPEPGLDLTRVLPLPLPSTEHGRGLTFALFAPLQLGRGIEAFCQAAHALKADVPGCRFVVAGRTAVASDGGMSTVGDALPPGTLEAYAGVVEYVGDVDPDTILANTHVVVHPSGYGEGHAKMLSYAMARGRPVIASWTRAARDLIDERVNGCFVPPGDAGSLKRAMASFLRRPELLAAMARASRAKAERMADQNLAHASLSGFTAM
ncbi:MAG: glycosyltransferase [Pseudomonadota bacterium]